MLKFMTVLFVLALLTLSRAEEIVDRENSGLDYFPHDVSEDVTELNLKGNNIAGIDYVEPFPALFILILSNNDLTDFPDLQNISNVLTKLYLRTNNINTIPANLLGQMDRLAYLDLGFNPVSSIPDVSGPPLYGLDLTGTDFSEIPRLPNLGYTLDSLSLAGSNIVELSQQSVDNLEILTDLDLLQLVNTGVREIPDMCLVNHQPLDLTLRGVVLDCGESSWKLKLAADYGRVSMRSDPDGCKTAEGAVIPWQEYISNQDLDPALLQRKYRLLRTLPTDYYCPRMITGSFEASPGLCAIHCLHDPDCAMFGLSGGVCHITTNGPGSSTQFNAILHWFEST